MAGPVDTPPEIAPEDIFCGKAKERCMVYSLGAVDRPISAPTTSDVMRLPLLPTGSIRTILSIDSRSSPTSAGSRSTVYVPPPMSTFTVIPDFQSDFSSNSWSTGGNLGLARRVSLPWKLPSSHGFNERLGPRVGACTQGTRSGLVGSPVTLSNGPSLGQDVFITHPPSLGKGLFPWLLTFARTDEATPVLDTSGVLATSEEARQENIYQRQMMACQSAASTTPQTSLDEMTAETKDPLYRFCLFQHDRATKLRTTLRQQQWWQRWRHDVVVAVCVVALLSLPFSVGTIKGVDWVCMSYANERAAVTQA
ncbi:hypothetical protein JOM56_000791 [Amanita muscaria]